MYEHFRNKLATELSKTYTNADIWKILAYVDKVAYDYDITEKSTEIMCIEDVFPPIAKTYIAVKSLEGLSGASINLYENRLRIFFEMVGKQPQDVTTNDIRIYLATYKAQRGVSDRTLDKYRQILDSFFKWAVDEEYMTKNPCRNIKAIKYEVKPRRSLSRIQLEELRRACRTKRERAIIDTLFSTGCRVAELVNMKKSDVNPDGESIQIVGKGKKHNTVYLNSNAILSLNEYFSERQDSSEYLFVSEYRPHNQMSTRLVESILSDLSQIIGFKVTPHVIRHTTATLGLQSGMKITEVQKMLGHASVNTTQIYAETSQEDVRTAHLKYVV